MNETVAEIGSGRFGLFDRKIFPGMSKLSTIPGFPGAESNMKAKT